MSRWRLLVVVVLFVVLGLPLALPFQDLVLRPSAWRAWGEAARLLHLAANTILLVGGTVALTLPVGTLLAVLLYRTDLPFRGVLRSLLLLTLFVPLPLLASGWQAAVGGNGWLPLAIWNLPLPTGVSIEAGGFAFPRWGQGAAALWIHTAAALPWVVLLAGQGLSWVERELEEDALTAAGPWRVLWRVSLPRCRVALAAAAFWVALQVAGEIAITDMMQVRTFAEEVYTQFVRPEIALGLGDERDMVAQALAVALPGVVGTVVLACWAAVRWERRLPPFAALVAPARQLPLGHLRWPAWLLGVLTVALVAGVPLGSLVWRVGLAGTPEAWSAAAAWHEVWVVWQVHGMRHVLPSLAYAGLAGVVLSSLTLLVCWLALRSRWFLLLVLVLAAALWAAPGPVIGLGLKAAIELVLQVTENPLAVRLLFGGYRQEAAGAVQGEVHRVVARALYYGPSPLPVLWAYLIRFFPFALALLWPVVRLFPARLRESAEVDGATPGRVFFRVVLPLTWLAAARAALAVAILALGELSASKLVETAGPGSDTFAHEVFTQMHFGISSTLAALCVLLLLAVTIGAGALAVADRLLRDKLRGWMVKDGQG